MALCECHAFRFIHFPADFPQVLIPSPLNFLCWLPPAKHLIAKLSDYTKDHNKCVDKIMLVTFSFSSYDINTVCNFYKQYVLRQATMDLLHDWQKVNIAWQIYDRMSN